MRLLVRAALCCIAFAIMAHYATPAHTESGWDAGMQVVVCPGTVVFESAGAFINAQEWFLDFDFVTLVDAVPVRGERWWEVRKSTSDGWLTGYIYEPAAAHCPELTAPTGIHNPILQAQLQPGDIVLSRIDLSDCPVTEVFCHAYQLYDGYWMHAGIVTHTDGEPGLVEATNPGGVAHRPLSNTSLSDDITVIRVNAPLEVRRAAADYALSMVGSPFSKDYYDKSRTDAFYCSQLIWAAYQSVNIDLDSNYLLTDATFTARFDASPLMQAMVMQYADGGVTPDDLLVSEHTTQIYH